MHVIHAKSPPKHKQTISYLRKYTRNIPDLNCTLRRCARHRKKSARTASERPASQTITTTSHGTPCCPVQNKKKLVAKRTIWNARVWKINDWNHAKRKPTTGYYIKFLWPSSRMTQKVRKLAIIHQIFRNDKKPPTSSGPRSQWGHYTTAHVCATIRDKVALLHRKCTLDRPRWL